MRFNTFLPVAALTAVTASMLSVSAPAQAQVSKMDLVGVGPIHYTQNALDFTTAPLSGATPNIPGMVNILSMSGTAFNNFGSPARIIDVFGGTNDLMNDVGLVSTSFGSPINLLEFDVAGGGTNTFSFTNISTEVDSVTRSLTMNFIGNFAGDGVNAPATLSVLTTQVPTTTNVDASTMLASLADIANPGTNSITSSFSMTLEVTQQAVPEPSALGGLLAVGLLGAGAGFKRRQKQAL